MPVAMRLDDAGWRGDAVTPACDDAPVGARRLRGGGQRFLRMQITRHMMLKPSSMCLHNDQLL